MFISLVIIVAAFLWVPLLMPPKKKARRASAPAGTTQLSEESRWTRTTIRGVHGVAQWPITERKGRAGKWYVNLNHWTGGAVRSGTRSERKRDGLYDSEQEARSFPSL
jgi:hypothetical protein